MGAEMGQFWDERAAENAFFFVDNRLDYRNPDLEQFWADGERDLRTLLELVGASLQPDDRVIEIGCGVGRLTRGLAREVASVCAVDASDQMLSLAKQHNSQLANVKWLLGDGTSLAGIETASADVCVSHVVFQHIPDPRITLGYIREMGRVLVADGWAAFQISNDRSVHRRDSPLKRVREHLAYRQVRMPAAQNDPNWLGSMVELEALKATASQVGLSCERVVGEGTQFCLVLLRRLSR